ncbi:MAG: sugar ABC transporter ATP-binding protein [Fusobacteriaceae bacterium]
MSVFLLEARNIIKEFPGVLALDNVNFNLKSGEVHALLGENGAGKSTMMKIFSGVHRKNGGELLIKGEVTEILSPIHAGELGIGIIYQELNLCPHLSVAENIFLSREFQKGMVVDNKIMIEESQKILDMLHADIDPKEKVKNLSISKRQIVEIAKALSQNAEIIIMDEPTSSLTDREVDKLFQIIHKLKEQGKGIVYISHKLDELKHITDRVTIFRDGKYIITENFSQITMNEIINHMVGRDIHDKFPRVERQREINPLLEIKNFSKLNLIENISLSIYGGEVLGIAGLVGAGRTELCKGIFGAYGKCSGDIYLEGKKVQIKSPQDAIEIGIAYVAEDRKGEGLAVNMSVSQNISFTILDMVSSKCTGVINKKDLESKAASIVDKLRIKTPSLNQKVKNLSGGNQQKIVIGKWLLRNPKIIIFDEPTRGIDVSAKIEIYKIINDLKEAGMAVVMISSELPEILGISDRIAVMCDKKVKKILDAKVTNQEEIMFYATQFGN